MVNEAVVHEGMVCMCLLVGKTWCFDMVTMNYGSPYRWEVPDISDQCCVIGNDTYVDPEFDPVTMDK